MDTPEIHLTKKDFTLEWFSGTGAGGQHRNKHMNCCRITHIETGLMATGQNSRSRVANQKDAFTHLASMILEHYKKPSDGRRDTTETIRTYHAVRNEVHDKASGLKLEYKDVVEKGNLKPLIDARRKSQTPDINQ